MGRGSALLVSGAPGAPAGIELRAPDTTFNRGAWTADRLNFYFRDDRGQVLAGIVVEDYFAPTPVQKPAKLDGALGNITLICTRASASAGATRE